MRVVERLCVVCEGIASESSFARRLADDPELTARCEAVAAAIRAAVAKDVRAGKRAEAISPNDYGVLINTRAQ